MSMKKISTVTLTSSAASITFSDIPQTGTDLIFRISEKNDSDNNTASTLRINGGTTILRWLYGEGGTYSVNSGYREYNSLYGWITSAGGISPAVFSSTTFYFPNYTSTTTKLYYNETAAENWGSYGAHGITAGTYPTSSPITSIQFLPRSNTFLAGTTMTMYAITKGSGGATVS